MTLVAPRRPVPTYVDDRRGECYRDTGRPVAEPLGTHVVLWIIEDPNAWAAAIEAAADAEVARWPGNTLAQQRRSQDYTAAAKIRAAGPRRDWRIHEHSAHRAAAHVTELHRSHPNPGVRYKAVEITAAGTCADCGQPTIAADGQWRHHLGGYPANCRTPAAGPGGPRQPGDWEIDVARGHMICGYCGQATSWAQALLGHLTLTGFHMLGIEKATGALVVLAEATTPSGDVTVLPHHCSKIPEDLRAKYTPELAATAP